MSIKEAINLIEDIKFDVATNTRKYAVLGEAIKYLENLKKIEDILKETDFDNEESLNADGEDFGYKESIFGIADVMGIDTEGGLGNDE